MRFTHLILSVLLLMLGAAGISADESADKLSAVGTHRSPSGEGASVGFMMLRDGDVLPGTFRLKFHISGMVIAPAGSMIDNSGHHHLLIDVPELPAMNQPLPATDHIRHFGKGQTEVELTLPEGQHTLQLLFADYSHTPHDPPVMSERVSVTVSAHAPPWDQEDD